MSAKCVGRCVVIVLLAIWSWTASDTKAELVGHWKLDEGSGDVFADSAAGNDGFLPDGVEVEWADDGPPGIQDVSVEFLGDLFDSYIETPFEGIGGNDPRTITLWVKADPQPDNTAMVAWGANTTGRKWHFRINQGTNSLRTEFSGGQNYAETEMTDGEWHFVASVFEGEVGDDIIHYLDAQEDFKAGGTSIDIDTAIDPADDAYPVHIGYAIPHAGRFFVGQMADVRIYDEALDQATLQAIMEGQDLGGAARLQAGDANMDYEFNQLDLVQVQIAAKYLTNQPATWGEGDWDGAPGGQPGNPPAGDGLFNQLDIIAALGAGTYLQGPYNALAHGNGELNDGQTSIVYNPESGELGVDAPNGVELTSVNIDSESAIFTGDPAQNLGGSFDNDSDDNIFKATFGSSFGSLSFGNVAPAGLSKDFVVNDLTVVGSLAGGGDLGAVDLVYVPEPTGIALLALGLLVGVLWRRARR